MRMISGTAAAFMFLLGACGGGEGDEPAENSVVTADASAAIDPCGLVTTAEVGEAIGEQVLAAKPSGTSCVYEAADAQASSVTVEVKAGAAAAEMDTMRKASGALGDIGQAVAQQGGAGQDVNAVLSEAGDQPKVGDDSLFGPNQLLSVRKGDTYISVQPPIMRSRMSAGNPMLSTDDKKNIALAIAEKAVAKLR